MVRDAASCDAIAVDTEYPAYEYQINDAIPFIFLRNNVNPSFAIQVAFTLFSEQHQQVISTYQYNLKFKSSGYHFGAKKNDATRNQNLGVEPSLFYQSLASSSILGDRNITFITLHGGIDYGYMIKGLTGQKISPNVDSFLNSHEKYFPRSVDLREVLRDHEEYACKGLQALVDWQGVHVPRGSGTPHTAGWDALATALVYLKLVNGSDVPPAKFSVSLGKVYNINPGLDPAVVTAAELEADPAKAFRDAIAKKLKNAADAKAKPPPASTVTAIPAPAKPAPTQVWSGPTPKRSKSLTRRPSSSQIQPTPMQQSQVEWFATFQQQQQQQQSIPASQGESRHVSAAPAGFGYPSQSTYQGQSMFPNCYGYPPQASTDSYALYSAPPLQQQQPQQQPQHHQPQRQQLPQQNQQHQLPQQNQQHQLPQQNQQYQLPQQNQQYQLPQQNQQYQQQQPQQQQYSHFNSPFTMLAEPAAYHYTLQQGMHESSGFKYGRQ